MKYNRTNLIGILYVLPAALIITLFFVSSTLFTIWLSFFEWNGISAVKWVGLDNYIRIFNSQEYLVSLSNTLIWVVASLVIPVSLGFILAIFLQNIKGQIIFKNIFYLPYAISMTVVAIIFSFLLQDNGINYLLAGLGLDSWVPPNGWLNTPPYHTFSMIIASVWQLAGTNMLLFLVGLGAVPKEPLEAAQIDGATGNKLIWYITLPLLKPVTIVVIGMTLVNSFKVFDIIWVMTLGGPYRSSETFAVTAVRESFMLSQYGQGSAVSIMLTIAVIGSAWFYLKRTIGRAE